MDWQPHITVAAIIERDEKFLLVEEKVEGYIVYNQPAGHWESGETLQEAAARETLEETGWEFFPSALVGIYRWKHPRKDETFLRFTFCGHSSSKQITTQLDKGIIKASWLRANEIFALPEIKIRSTMVTHSLQDYLDGKRFDINLIHDVNQHW